MYILQYGDSIFADIIKVVHSDVKIILYYSDEINILTKVYPWLRR